MHVCENSPILLQHAHFLVKVLYLAIWLNTVAFIILVPKIDTVAIQNRPLATQCLKTMFIPIIN